jgi:TPR repeat protein
MRIIILLICTALSSKAYAVEECDLHGSLEADPLSISEPVKFQDIQGAKLIEVCTIAINKQNGNLPRHHLLRARGYLSSGSYEEAKSDITYSHEMGYAAATFALATLHHFGDSVPQDLLKAATLYEQAYNDRVTWAARGLSILYDDLSFDDYDPKLSKDWLYRFEGN